MRQTIRRVIEGAFCAGMLAILAACAGVDPQHVGNGQYLQIVQGSEVLLEMDTSSAGLLNCTNTAYQSMQAVPSLKGMLRCSETPTTSALPFSYRAHNTKTATADHVLQSSPYLVRAKTSHLCAEALAADRAGVKIDVLEDNCNVASGVAASGAARPPKANAALEARFFALSFDGKLTAQVDMGTAAQCKELWDATAKGAEAPENKANMKRATYGCSATSAGNTMAYRAVLRDQLLDAPYEIATITQQMCELTVVQLMATVTPQINKPRFAVSQACARRA